MAASGVLCVDDCIVKNSALSGTVYAPTEKWVGPIQIVDRSANGSANGS